MQAKTRTNQGGSVINFLIVGVILAAIALAAIFFAQQRGKDVATEPSPSPTTSPSTQPSPTVQAPSMSPRPSTQPSATPAPSSVPQAGVMPQTGPSDTLMTLLPLAIMTIVFVAYLQSRRATS